MAVSPFYRTAPVGLVSQPWYINGVVVVKTAWGPRALLRFLRRMETRFGRNRKHETRWGPRPLDLDLLFYDNRIIRSPTLLLPHPHLHRRRFVLVPLADTIPKHIHPVLCKTVDTLLSEVDDTSLVERLPETAPTHRYGGR